MYQLRKQGKITHNIMAIYSVVEVLDANNNTRFVNSSNVKFGSWDSEAIVKDDSLHMFKCRDLNAWQVAARHFYIGQNAFIPDSHRYLEINP